MSEYCYIIKIQNRDTGEETDFQNVVHADKEYSAWCLCVKSILETLKNKPEYCLVSITSQYII